MCYDNRVPVPNLKKIAKTKRGIAAIALAVTWFLWLVGIVGDFQTITSFRPYLHYASALSTYGAIVGAWAGQHLISIIGIGISVGLFVWAARDVAAQEREDPPANMISSFTTIRRVAIGNPPYNWEIATTQSLDPQVALVARFANRARTIPVGVAHNVRADIFFEDADGSYVASHPAPWLFCPSPIVTFDVGAQNELLMALDVLDLPQMPPPASMAQGRPPQGVLRSVEDVADREPHAAARYSFHRGLSGSVKAKVYLTVNGLAVPPYEFELRPSDRSVTPQTPPTIREIPKRARWQKIWDATKAMLQKSLIVGDG